jgi:putative transposase
MKKTKFSEEKIAYVMRQVEAGKPAVEVCREHGVSEPGAHWADSIVEEKV